MAYYLKLFFSTFIFFLLIDIIWLGLIAKNMYFNQIGFLLRTKAGALDPNWYAGLSVYVLLVAGILIFVLPNAEGSYIKAVIYGSLFGLITYGVYDLTNLSIVANWPLNLTLIDIVWGTFLCMIVSVFATMMQAMFQ